MAETGGKFRQYIRRWIPGTEAATHAPGSAVFRQSYDRETNDLDVFAVAAADLGEGVETEKVRKAASWAVTRIITRRIDRDQFLQQFVEKDEDVKATKVFAAESPSPEVTNGVKNTQRRAFYHGNRALDLEERKLSDESSDPQFFGSPTTGSSKIWTSLPSRLQI
jgi:hypothetical protein